MKILIVDDTRVVQLIVERAIKKCGYDDLEIKTASNGEDAFSIVQSWLPDLVITDWHMPVMTGLDLLKKIKNNGYEGTKVGLITAEPSEKRLDEARRDGAAFIINKPCDENEIINCVLSCLKEAEQSLRQETELKNEISEISSASLASIMEGVFGSSLKISLTNRRESDDYHGTFLITLYGLQNSSSIKAISIIDKKAINLFGGLLAKKTLDEIENLNNKDGVDASVAKLAIEFLAMHTSDFFDGQDKKKNKLPLKIKSKGIVSQLPEKVRKTIDEVQNRKDFIIRYDETYTCFMSLTIM